MSLHTNVLKYNLQCLKVFKIRAWIIFLLFSSRGITVPNKALNDLRVRNVHCNLLPSIFIKRSKLRRLSTSQHKLSRILLFNRQRAFSLPLRITPTNIVTCQL